MHKPVTFESSIEQSADLIRRLEEKTISIDNFQTESVELLGSVSGARGFFVALLTGGWQFGNEVPEPAIRACEVQSAIAEVLLTKNLIMSTCMEVEHRRKGSEENRTGSLTVQQRSMYMMDKIKSGTLKEHLIAARNAIDGRLSGTKQEGNTFADFFNRWTYDEEQLKAARNAITSVLRSAFGIST